MLLVGCVLGIVKAASTGYDYQKAVKVSGGPGIGNVAVVVVAGEGSKRFAASTGADAGLIGMGTAMAWATAAVVADPRVMLLWQRTLVPWLLRP